VSAAARASRPERAPGAGAPQSGRAPGGDVPDRGKPFKTRSEGASRADPDRDKAFKTELTRLIPQLRAFARSLTGDATSADDLAQDAMLKAWDARESFEMGTNMKAWAFMILRNQFYSEKRRSWRQTQLDQDAAERTLAAADDPAAPLALDELRMGLAMLPTEQREALILVGAGGFAYEEAAQICDCAVGTVKSRVSRARQALAEILRRGDYVRDGASASEAMSTILAQAERLSNAR
jgi:RNA polymerase sigma-70 factor (ECF subfamily)